MEYLTDIGLLIIGALGLVVFLVIMWFVIGMFLVMKDIFLRRKPPEQNFITHDEIINSLKEKRINNN